MPSSSERAHREQETHRHKSREHPRGGGWYMTSGWTGVCHPVFRKVPTSNYRNLLSYPLAVIPNDGFWRKTAHFCYFSSILDKPSLFMKNLPKRGDPCLENFCQKPTHIGGTLAAPFKAKICFQIEYKVYYRNISQITIRPGLIVICKIDYFLLIFSRFLLISKH